MLYLKSKAPLSEAEKFVSRARLSFTVNVCTSNDIQTWRSPNHKREAEIRDQLMASNRLVEDRDRQTGDEAEPIVVRNSTDYHLVISETSLRDDEMIIAQCGHPRHAGSRRATSIVSVTEAQSLSTIMVGPAPHHMAETGEDTEVPVREALMMKLLSHFLDAISEISLMFKF